MTKYKTEINVMSGASITERDTLTKHKILLEIEKDSGWVIAIAICPLCGEKGDGKSQKRVVAAQDALTKLTSHIKYAHQSIGNFVFEQSWKPQISKLSDNVVDIIGDH